jgi:hypothetical protein
LWVNAHRLVQVVAERGDTAAAMARALAAKVNAHPAFAAGARGSTDGWTDIAITRR